MNSPHQSLARIMQRFGFGADVPVLSFQLLKQLQGIIGLQQQEAITKKAMASGSLVLYMP